MKVSVIIPTYNRLGQLRRVLEGLEKQSYPRDGFEVLIISDGSTDGTEDYLRVASPSFHLRAFSQPNQGAAAARNLGITQATEEIVLFIDDDVFPFPDLIAEHLHSHETLGNYAVVIGPMLAPPDFQLSPWVRWEADQLAEQYRDMSDGRWSPTARQFYTGNTSIARHHLVESGGFDPAFRRAEDVELAYRLANRGLKFFFNPRAAGYLYAARSFAAWLSTPYDYGRNDVVFSRQKGQAWLLPAVLREYLGRHTQIHALVSICLSQPILSKTFLTVSKQIVLLGEKFPLGPISSLACSSMFNLRYYEGIADGLGGRQAFFRAVDKAGLAA